MTNKTTINGMPLDEWIKKQKEHDGVHCGSIGGSVSTMSGDIYER